MGRKFGWHSGKVTCYGQDNTGKQVAKRVSTDATYTVLADDFIIGCDTSGGAFTVTIPTSLVEAGRTLIVNDEATSAGGANITIATEGAETIDGGATASIAVNDASLALYSDGVNWFSY